MEHSFIINNALLLSFAIMLLALVFALYRLIKGPTVHDRIAAMDLIAVITMAFILLYSVMIKNPLYFDIVILISLIAFMGTIAVSAYFKQKR